MSSVYRLPHVEVVVLFFALWKMDSCNLSNEACNLSAISVLTIKFCSKVVDHIGHVDDFLLASTQLFL